MKKKNPFKIETEKHRTPMARREQVWAWLRKMKKEHNKNRKYFVQAALDMGHFKRKAI